MTLGEIYALAKNSIDALDARLLLEEASGYTHADLIARSEIDISEEVATKFLSWVKRRASGEPFAYLIGQSEFRGRCFKVSPSVLIPRPETELLVDVALKKIQKKTNPKILELGTGSGIIAISLALECPAAEVTAIDISNLALDIAEANALQLGANVRFIEGSWFSPLLGERFDLIVSNPPYIAVNDPHLKQGGLPFEPHLALTDGADGLSAIRNIVSKAPDYLLATGWLILEHGYDQGEICRNFLIKAGLQDSFTLPDISGVDRVSGAHL